MSSTRRAVFAISKRSCEKLWAKQMLRRTQAQEGATLFGGKKRENATFPVHRSMTQGSFACKIIILENVNNSKWRGNSHLKKQSRSPIHASPLVSGVRLWCDTHRETDTHKQIQLFIVPTFSCRQENMCIITTTTQQIRVH
jgi:hypothetical protein